MLRAMRREDVAAVVALQSRCFPPPFPVEELWQPEHLLAHLDCFPVGQFVVEEVGQIIASASNNRISEVNWCSQSNWEMTNGGHSFKNFDCRGSTLFGADISVDPLFRGQGVGRSLYEARFQLVRTLGLKRYGTACRIPEYSSSPFGEVETYVSAVEAGSRSDRTLTPLLKYGLKIVGILGDYMEDEESGNSAVLLEWAP